MRLSVRLILLLLVAIAPLHSAPLPDDTVPWMDLSGQWRWHAGDQPDFAQPGFDDSGWSTLRLPGERRETGQFWLRRTLQISASAAAEPLWLTVGIPAEAYQVYANGRLIGQLNCADDNWAVPAPRSFSLPRDALPSDRRLVVAIRARWRPGFSAPHPSWRLPDQGPYLVSAQAQVPVHEARRQLDQAHTRLTIRILLAMFAAVFAALALGGWLLDRRRHELLWFAILELARFANVGFLAWGLSHTAFFWPQRLVNLTNAPLEGVFILSALGVRGPALLIPWAPLLLLGPGSEGTRVILWSSAWSSLVGGAAWVLDWRRGRSQPRVTNERLLRGCLFLMIMSLADNSFPRLLDLPWTGSFLLGSYQVARFDLARIPIAFAVLAFLLNRSAEDRRERDRLAGELEAARGVQSLLLPAGQPGLDAVYLPANEVGGDFWHFYDDRLLVVGDVSGKGLKAAMVVSLITGMLDRRHADSPAALLAELNHALHHRLNGGFVTCCIVRLDGDGQLTAANAGHPAPYLNGVELDLPPGLPLGLAPDADYDEHTVPFQGSLTLVSDGVIEAENPQRELFGFDRTREISTQSAQQIADAAKAWGQNDDITVVTVRRSA